MHRKLLAVLALSACAALAQTGALVYTKGGDAWIMNTDGSNQTRLTTTGGVGQLRLSNNVLVYAANGQYYRATLSGFAFSAPPQPVPNTVGAYEFDLSPDGSRIVFTYYANSNDTFFMMNVDGTNFSVFNSGNGAEHRTHPTWGRDGYIYFVPGSIGNAFSQTIRRIPENGGAQMQITNYFSQFPSAGLPGNRVAFLYDYPVKRVRTMNGDGTAVIDVPGLTVGDGSFISVDYFTDYIYYPIGDQIWRIRPDGSGNQMLVSGVFNYVDYGTLTIDNTPPVVTSLSIAPNPVAVNTATTLTATFTDAGGSGLATSQYTLDGGSPQPFATLSGSAASGSLGIAAFPTAGVHNFCVRAQDFAGNYSPYSCTLLAVYDRSAGFVTGGGWLAPKNIFGLVAAYLPNATVPHGAFEFHPGTNKFKATAFAWLVVSGNQAILQGIGTWNGTPGYLFEVTARNAPDQLAVRVWNGSGTVHQTALTPLAFGQIVIH